MKKILLAVALILPLAACTQTERVPVSVLRPAPLSVAWRPAMCAVQQSALPLAAWPVP